METLLVVMGARIKLKQGEYVPGHDFQERLNAGYKVWEEEKCKILITGGAAVGVRYNIFGELKCNFSSDAVACASEYPIEAMVGKKWLMNRNVPVPSRDILFEINSLYTEETIRMLFILLERSTYEELEEVFIISHQNHLSSMKDDLNKYSPASLQVTSLAVEDVLRPEPISSFFKESVKV